MAEQQVTISCPHCAYSRAMPRNRVPSGTVRVTCPKCGESIHFPARPPHARELSREPDGAAASGDPRHGDGPRADFAAPPPARSAKPRTLAFSFAGTGGEYFGIWMVNTLLKIMTCGIYSAWAKVRKRSYFYGSTTLHGEPFTYLADPLTIFKGWLIGAAAFSCMRSASG